MLVIGVTARHRQRLTTLATYVSKKMLNGTSEREYPWRSSTVVWNKVPTWLSSNTVLFEVLCTTSIIWSRPSLILNFHVIADSLKWWKRSCWCCTFFYQDATVGVCHQLDLFSNHSHVDLSWCGCPVVGRPFCAITLLCDVALDPISPVLLSCIHPLPVAIHSFVLGGCSSFLFSRPFIDLKDLGP